MCRHQKLIWYQIGNSEIVKIQAVFTNAEIKRNYYWLILLANSSNSLLLILGIPQL
jgi:hypothetical protein